jgi:hypothetical protein
MLPLTRSYLTNNVAYLISRAAFRIRIPDSNGGRRHKRHPDPLPRPSDQDQEYTTPTRQDLNPQAFHRIIDAARGAPISSAAAYV